MRRPFSTSTCVHTHVNAMFRKEELTINRSHVCGSMLGMTAIVRMRGAGNAGKDQNHLLWAKHRVWYSR